MPKYTGLGRGLGALLPKQKEKNIISERKIIPSLVSSDAMLHLPLEHIIANPHQPRKQFSDASLKELADSIKTYGILEPLLVAPLDDGTYELIAGERRLRAAKLIGFSTVPAIIRKSKEQEKLEIALIENIQRKNLNPVEEAHAYLELIDEFGLKQEEVAVRIGKNRSSIANTLRILSLPEEILDAIGQEKISEGHARTLAAMDNEAEQRTLFQKILSARLTVRDTEEYVRSYKRKRSGASVLQDPELIEQQRLLEEKFSTRVRIQKRKGKGKIIVEFYSDEEFSNIIGEIFS